MTTMPTATPPLIIDRTELKSAWRDRTEWTITVAAWLLWVYMFMPMATLLLWYVGLRLFVIEQFRLSDVRGFAQIVGLYLLVSVGIWALLQIWNLYNRIRFCGRDRRKWSPEATVEELAATFGVSPARLTEARDWRRISVSFDGRQVTDMRPSE